MIPTKTVQKVGVTWVPKQRIGTPKNETLKATHILWLNVSCKTECGATADKINNAKQVTMRPTPRICTRSSGVCLAGEGLPGGA
jgi:hypothetical protein